MRKLIMICGVVALAGCAFGRGTPLRGAPVNAGDGVRLVDMTAAISLAKAEAIARMGIESTLAYERPGFATVSITTDLGVTSWFVNLASIENIPNKSTVRVWSRQDLYDSIELPATTNSIVRGVGTDRIPIMINWDNDTGKTAFRILGWTNTLERLDVVNLYNNTNATGYAYTLYAINDLTVRDCGIYFAGKYKHVIEDYGYKALVIVGNSGKCKIYNSTIGALSADETGHYNYAHVAALHGSVEGSLLENVTFINSRTGSIDGGGYGAIEMIGCKANVTGIDNTMLIGSAEARQALPSYLQYYLTDIQDVVDAKIIALNPNGLGVVAMPVNAFSIGEPTGGWMHSLDPDTATANQIAAVLSTLISELGLLDYALDFDGVDDYVRINTGVMDIQPTDTSVIGFDVICNFASASMYLYNNMANSAPGEGVYYTTGKINYVLRNHHTDSTIKVTWDSPAANIWHSYRFVYDGSVTAAGVDLYIDDVLQAPTIAVDNLGASINYDFAHPALGGQVGSSLFFDGSMDNFLHLKNGDEVVSVNFNSINGSVVAEKYGQSVENYGATKVVGWR